MLLVVLLEQSGTAGTAWNKCWDSLSRPSQLGTLLGELGFWDNWTVLSSTVQVKVGFLMFCRRYGLAMRVSNVWNVDSDSRQIVGVGKHFVALLWVRQIFEENGSYSE